MNENMSVLTPSAELAISPKIPRPKEYRFVKATDSRGNPIRGLWQRGERYYAQLRVPGKEGAVRVPLVDDAGAPLRTVAQSRAALHELQKQRRENRLPVLKRTPTLGEWIETYLAWLRTTNAKDPATITKEAGHLKNWSEKLGTIRLAHLRRSDINFFVEWRKGKNEVSNRTINLDVTVLKSCLKYARQQDLIQRLPTENWEPGPSRTGRRPTRRQT